MGAIVIALPGAPEWKNQQAFTVVFGFIPRILAASLIAYWAGEFANSYTMAKLKLLTNGRSCGRGRSGRRWWGRRWIRCW